VAANHLHAVVVVVAATYPMLLAAKAVNIHTVVAATEVKESIDSFQQKEAQLTHLLLYSLNFIYSKLISSTALHTIE
jgi:hypothetical protein